MPTDVKLNAEGVEAARAVLVEGRDNFATFEQHAAGIVRAYLAALDNSKPTPAGDDGLIARLNAACIGNPYALIPWPRGLLHKAASALATAHSQHEADVARIAELTEALRPFARMYVSEIHVDPTDGRWEIHVTGPVQPTFSMFERARALTKVKP